MLNKKCIFPGSFTRFHEGHQHILKRAAALFKEVIVLVVINETKNNGSTLNLRYNNAKLIIEKMNLDNVKVDYYHGMTVDYMKKNNCKYMVRGIRNTSDLNYEQKLAKQYLQQDPKIDIICFLNRLDI